MAGETEVEFFDWLMDWERGTSPPRLSRPFLCTSPLALSDARDPEKSTRPFAQPMVPRAKRKKGGAGGGETERGGREAAAAAGDGLRANLERARGAGRDASRSPLSKARSDVGAPGRSRNLAISLSLSFCSYTQTHRGAEKIEAKRRSGRSCVQTPSPPISFVSLPLARAGAAATPLPRLRLPSRVLASPLPVSLAV